MPKLSLQDLSLNGKRVLMRVDFNVPMNRGAITDDSRIKAAIPSIEYILKQGASLVLMSHLGRPKGKEPSLSLASCAKRLSELIKKPVQMASDCIGPEVEAKAKALKKGEILLLENLRFYEAEETPEKDPTFVEKLAKLGSCYVNDAFGTAHRAHSSTAMIAKYFPHKAAAGFLMQKEIEALTPLITHPQRPFYAIIGGAKISTKIGVIHKLLQLVDGLFIGGAMTFTFLKADHIDTGSSPCEDPSEIMHLDRSKIFLPEDLVIADAFDNSAHTKTIPLNSGIPNGWQGVDIGPKTVDVWSKKLQTAASIFWNGPLGVFEMPNFAKGTKAIAQTLANSKALTIVGGGDSIAAIEQTGLAKKFTHLSTGGGASLEFLEYGHLPGIDALSDKT
jgi:phosphoglycerate kinase